MKGVHYTMASESQNAKLLVLYSNYILKEWKNLAVCQFDTSSNQSGSLGTLFSSQVDTIINVHEIVAVIAGAVSDG